MPCLRINLVKQNIWYDKHTSSNTINSIPGRRYHFLTTSRFYTSLDTDFLPRAFITTYRAVLMIFAARKNTSSGKPLFSVCFVIRVFSVQLNPMILPVSGSISISINIGRVGSPGMVDMVPSSG